MVSSSLTARKSNSITIIGRTHALILQTFVEKCEILPKLICTKIIHWQMCEINTQLCHFDTQLYHPLHRQFYTKENKYVVVR